MAPKLKMTALWLYVALLLTGGFLGLRNTTANEVVVGSYVALLLGVGVIGRIKVGIGFSLLIYVVFALLLALCTIIHVYFAEILIGILAILFGNRYFKTGKFMPSGLVLAFSLVALTLLQLPMLIFVVHMRYWNPREFRRDFISGEP